MLTLMGYPIVNAILVALRGPSGELTLDNFRVMIGDFYFREALIFTLLLTFVVVPLETLIAVVLALYFAMTRFKGSALALYIFILPLAISDIAAALLWYNILTSGGFLNKVLLNLGVIDKPIYFFGYAYRHMEFIAIVLAEVWRSTAIVFVILYAGVQLVNRELLEAADVFGMSFTQKLRYVLIPLLKPSIEAALLVRTLFALQIFATPLALAGLDIPVLASVTYYWLTERWNAQVATCYALTIGAITIAVGFIYIRLLRARHLEVV